MAGFFGKKEYAIKPAMVLLSIPSSLQFTGTIVQNNSPIVLSKASVITDPTRYFNGKIDELLFYNRALTEV